jgi:hypothetical protein
MVNMLADSFEDDALSVDELKLQTQKKARIFRHFASQFPLKWLRQLNNPVFESYRVPFFDPDVLNNEEADKGSSDLE